MMFKQLEYSEMLFKNLFLKFGPGAYDESLIGNESPYKVDVMFRSTVVRNS